MGDLTDRKNAKMDADLAFSPPAQDGPSPLPATPASKWRADGDPDPHGRRYDCERAALVMGHLTDDQLANAMFLCDHRTSFDSMSYLTAAKDRIRWLSRALAQASLKPETFQARVIRWIRHCFGAEVAADKVERNHRFLEEALELVQAGGCTASEAHQLVDYVFGRPVGEVPLEVGGVMNTLAALCTAHGVDLDAAAETELARVWVKSDAIRAKWLAKP
ncbi:MAG: hypothetical protein JWR10_443, partial [Rubritepida sp.]|nr:hypothetical protein [Rubritepida sp.]